VSIPVPEDLWDARTRFARPDALSFIAGRRAPQGTRRAAVLILFSQGRSGYDLVLIQKRADLRSHPGQVAFPGGGIEAADADPVAAALREADEEVGVDPTTVDVLGALPTAHIPHSGFDVTPVVGWWRDPVPLVPVDVREVASVYQVPVTDLLDPAHRTTWTHPLGFTGPAFEVGDLYVWGFTAYLLDGLFDLLDWTLPWDASRLTEIPPRFLLDGP